MKQNPPPPPSKRDLSPPRQVLLELMQDLNFGRFERLVIRDGDPVLDPGPARHREWKFRAENGPRPELSRDDFALKAQVVELFEYFDSLRNGTIDVLEIKHGLPFRAVVKEDAA